MNELITMNAANMPTFTNKDLNTATRRVFALGERIRKSALETAAVIAAVDKSGCYKDDGFRTVHDWTKHAFGFGKSTSYNMLTVGTDYVTPILNKAGKVSGYSSVYANGLEDGDFSVTQIVRLLPAGPELAGDLVESGKVKPSMTCKQIEEVVKAAKVAESEKDVEDTTDVEDVEDVEDTAEVEGPYRRQAATVDIIPEEEAVYVNFGDLTYKFTIKEWVDHCQPINK